MVPTTATDWLHIPLSSGFNLHIHSTERYKTVRIDLILPVLLRPFQNTNIALLGRLAERGTQRYPDLIALNRYVDELYGATYNATVETCGINQLLHLSWECLDDRYIPGGEPLWPKGLAFLREVLIEPAGREGSYRQADFDQEKAALSQYIESLNNDKSGYAFRNIKEMLCRGETCSLPAYGNKDDLCKINASKLWQMQRQIAQENPIELFINGPIAPEECCNIVTISFRGLIHGRDAFHKRGEIGTCLEVGKEHWENQGLAQGRLFMGGHTQIALADVEFPILILLNAILGGDSNSQLFRCIREEAGLAYQIQSFLDPLNGLIFIETACSQIDYGKIRYLIQKTITNIANSELFPEEVVRGRKGIIQSLEALDDSREGIMYYGLRQRLVGGNRGREQLMEELKKVTPKEIQKLAKTIGFEAVFFLK